MAAAQEAAYASRTHGIKAKFVRQWFDPCVFAATVNTHTAWMERNQAWAPPQQMVPFLELSVEDQEKDWIIVLASAQCFAPHLPERIQTFLMQQPK